jgi:hypothetical protein
LEKGRKGGQPRPYQLGLVIGNIKPGFRPGFFFAIMHDLLFAEPPTTVD